MTGRPLLTLSTHRLLVAWLPFASRPRRVSSTSQPPNWHLGFFFPSLLRSVIFSFFFFPLPLSVPLNLFFSSSGECVEWAFFTRMFAPSRSPPSFLLTLPQSPPSRSLGDHTQRFLFPVGVMSLLAEQSALICQRSSRRFMKIQRVPTKAVRVPSSTAPPPPPPPPPIHSRLGHPPLTACSRYHSPFCFIGCTKGFKIMKSKETEMWSQKKGLKEYEKFACLQH